MILYLKRQATENEVTMGRLEVNGSYFCDTLEEAVRSWENFIDDKTAVMEGSFSITMNEPTYNTKLRTALLNKFAPRFRSMGNQKAAEYCNKYILPRLDYTDPLKQRGYLIHSGNTIEHTEGCILVGKRSNPKLRRIAQSVDTLLDLYARLVDANERKEEIYIKIENYIDDKLKENAPPVYFPKMVCSAVPHKQVCSAFEAEPLVCSLPHTVNGYGRLWQ